VTRFSSSGYINDLAAGQLCVVMGYSGDINIARQRAIDSKSGHDIQALIPPSRCDAVLRHDGHPQGRQEREERAPLHQLHPAPRGARRLSNKVFYANPNAASKKFVVKSVAENPTIFLSAADIKKLTTPDAVPQEIRRVQTRIFTGFKANAK
jgi:putrescine transport system substrate-binding protein